MPVVDEDRRDAGLVVVVRGEAADVPAVAHRDQGKHRDLGVLCRVEGAEQGVEWKEPDVLVGELVPERLRDEVLLRQVERVEVDHLVVRQALALVGDDLLRDRHDAEREPYAERLTRLPLRLDEGLGLDLRLRVVIGKAGPQI